MRGVHPGIRRSRPQPVSQLQFRQHPTEGGRVLSPSRRDRPASSHVVQFDLQPTFLAPRVSHCRTKLPQNPQTGTPLRPVLRTPLRPTGEETEALGVGECRSAPSPGPLLVLSRFPALHVDLSALVFLTKGPRVTALPAGAVLERRVPGLTRPVGRLEPTDGEKRVPGCVGPRYRREVRAEPV